MHDYELNFGQCDKFFKNIEIWDSKFENNFIDTNICR